MCCGFKTATRTLLKFAQSWQTKRPGHYTREGSHARCQTATQLLSTQPKYHTCSESLGALSELHAQTCSARASRGGAHVKAWHAHQATLHCDAPQWPRQQATHMIMHGASNPTAHSSYALRVCICSTRQIVGEASFFCGGSAAPPYRQSPRGDLSMSEGYTGVVPEK
jgi:hypothetical protein